MHNHMICRWTDDKTLETRVAGREGVVRFGSPSRFAQIEHFGYLRLRYVKFHCFRVYQES